MDFTDVPSIEAIMTKVIEVADADLQFDIDHLQKTHLLRNRLELTDKTFSLVTRRRRHYLTLVAVPAHRKALTRLLLSDHNLSVERLRYPVRYRLAIPREHRLCRFCEQSVEDEAHALFDCNSHAALVDARAEFMADIFVLDGCLEAVFQEVSTYNFLKHVVSSRKAVARVARFVCEVFNLYDRYQRYIPEGFGIP